MSDTNELALRRIHRTEIGSGLVPSVTLLRDLIKLLNETRTQQGRKVQEILERMLEIEGMAGPVKGSILTEISLKRDDPAKFKLFCEIDAKLALLARELANFKFIPRAEVFFGGGGDGASQWSTWWGRPREKREEHLRMAPSEAVEVILKLTQIGYLSRLKRCSHCQKWLFAKFRHQEFCSVGCQQKRYTQSDQWKKHRREYMREYYHTNYSRARRIKYRAR
jgi:hypothetical protein